MSARRYDSYLLLNGVFTVTGLAEGDVLIDMLRSCSEDDHLKLESSEAVVALRDLHTRGVYPFSPEERKQYTRELNLKKGDYMYNNTVEANFGQYVQINDPYTLINGTGTLGPDGSRISFYRWGLFLHPTEHHRVMEFLYFQLSILVNAIDEYKEEILGKDASDILLKKTTGCANCDSDETKLLMCGGCKMIFYCSKH
eukprot:gene33430-41250_t